MKNNPFTCFLVCAFLTMVSPFVNAGTVVTGEGKTLEEAMEAAKRNVEESAKKANRCVSEYPKLETCTQLNNSTFRCQGIRANHKGSCK